MEGLPPISCFCLTYGGQPSKTRPRGNARPARAITLPRKARPYGVQWHLRADFAARRVRDDDWLFEKSKTVATFRRVSRYPSLLSGPHCRDARGEPRGASPDRRRRPNPEVLTGGRTRNAIRTSHRPGTSALGSVLTACWPGWAGRSRDSGGVLLSEKSPARSLRRFRRLGSAFFNPVSARSRGRQWSA
jgi:hypothetical protein